MERTALASVVYSDEEIFVFMDILPVNSGHVLAIPKAHAARLSELQEETGFKISCTRMRISKGLARSGVRCEGVMMRLSEGEAVVRKSVMFTCMSFRSSRLMGFG